MGKIGESLEVLMQKAIDGDKLAYDKVLTEIAIMIRPYFAKRLSNPNEVEDVVQETMISVHKSRHTYNNERPFKPWVFAIAKYRLADYLRSYYAKNLQMAENIDEVGEIPDLDVTEPDFNYESLKKEVFKLGGKQPMILHLIHTEGFTSKEVAEKMRMTEAAVKVSAHRAYKILRKRLRNG